MADGTPGHARGRDRRLVTTREALAAAAGVARDAGAPGDLQLDAARAAGEALPAALARILLYAAACAEAGRVEPARSVHEYRKSIRRARALVRLLRPTLRARDFTALDGALRQAVADTSALRDAEILEGTAHALPHTPALDAARGELVAFLRARHAEDCAPERIARVLVDSAGALGELPGRLADALPRALDLARLGRCLRASARRARRAGREALATRTDEAIHRWRKRVKELRYQLEMLEGRPLHGRTEPPRDVDQPRERALGVLAKGLGEVTDLAVLRATVVRHAGALGAAADHLVEAIDRAHPARFDAVVEAGLGPCAERPRLLASAVLGGPAPRSAPSRPAAKTKAPAKEKAPAKKKAPAKRKPGRRGPGGR